MPDTWTLPSSKVVTQTLVALLVMAVLAAAGDTSILEPLPDAVEIPAAAALIALAGYLKKERRPAPDWTGK